MKIINLDPPNTTILYYKKGLYFTNHLLLQSVEIGVKFCYCGSISMKI